MSDDDQQDDTIIDYTEDFGERQKPVLAQGQGRTFFVLHRDSSPSQGRKGWGEYYLGFANLSKTCKRHDDTAFACVTSDGHADSFNGWEIRSFLRALHEGYEVSLMDGTEGIVDADRDKYICDTAEEADAVRLTHDAWLSILTGKVTYTADGTNPHEQAGKEFYAFRSKQEQRDLLDLIEQANSDDGVVARAAYEKAVAARAKASTPADAAWADTVLNAIGDPLNLAFTTETEYEPENAGTKAPGQTASKKL